MIKCKILIKNIKLKNKIKIFLNKYFRKIYATHVFLIFPTQLIRAVRKAWKKALGMKI